MLANFSPGVSPEKAIAQFVEFITHSAIKPKYSLNPIPDGKLHRFPVEGDKGGETSGAYCLHIDDCPAGFVQDWHGTKTNWKYSFDPDERREYGRQMHNPETRAKSEAERRESEHRKAKNLKLQEEKQQQARALALAEYNHSRGFSHVTGLIQHPYWKAKFLDTGLYLDYVNTDICSVFPIARVIQPYKGGLCRVGELLIPMLNVATGDFQSLIHIPATPNQEGKFSKLNYKGLSIQGAAHIIISAHTKNTDTLFVTEGITTAIAVAIDTRGDFPVYAAGSCVNLAPVCEALKRRYTKEKFILVADNDKAGIEAAETCKSKGLAKTIKVPPGQGQDWYDYLLSRNEEIHNYEG